MMFEHCKTCPATTVVQCKTCEHKPSAPAVIRFEPYVDIHTTGEPTYLSTRKERDEFHQKNGVTLDSNRYARRKKRGSAVDEVPTEQILHDLKTGNFPRPEKKLASVEGEPLQNRKI